MDRKSSTSTVRRALSTILKLTITIAPLAAALLSAGKRKHPQNKDDRPGSGEGHFNHHQQTISVAELNQLPAAINEYKSSSQKQNTRDVRRFWIELFGMILFVVTAVLAGLNLWFLNKSVKAENDAVAEAQKQTVTNINSSRFEQRAWIQVKFGTIRLTLGIPATVHMTFENIGKTPARHVFGYIVPNFLPAAEMPTIRYEPGFPRGVFQAGIIYSGVPQEADYQVLPKIAPLPRDVKPLIPTIVDIHALDNRTKRISVHGQIWYDDVFGVHHWLTYCHSGTVGGDADIALLDCASYNGMDDEQEYPNKSQPFVAPKPIPLGKRQPSQ